jgi:hypothetical protein
MPCTSENPRKPVQAALKIHQGIGLAWHTQFQFGTNPSHTAEFDAAAEDIGQGQAAAAIQVTSLADRIRTPFPGSTDILYPTLPSGEAWPNLKLLRKVGYDNGYSRLVTMPRRGKHPRQA